MSDSTWLKVSAGQGAGEHAAFTLRFRDGWEPDLHEKLVALKCLVVLIPPLEGDSKE